MLEFILAAIAVFLVFGYFGLAIGWWTLAGAALLIYLSLAVGLGPVANLIIGSVFIVIAAVLNVPSLRRKLVTDRILALYRRILPDMSQTEKEAIDAGTVWWDGELFSGKPRWENLLATPAPRLSAEEQAFLDGPVEELCAMCDDWEVTHERMTDLEMRISEARSQIADVDMAKAYMEFQTQNTMYQSALAAGSRIMTTSLLDFI